MNANPHAAPPAQPSPEEFCNRGVALAEQGKLDEGIVQLRRATELRPDYDKAHHNLGVALAQAGKAEEAVRSLRQALHLNPRYAEAYYNLGNVLLGQGKHADAVVCYWDALRIRPDYAEVYNNLGVALTDLGKPDEATVILWQGARLRPDSGEAYNNLGLALAELGRLDEADAQYQQALRLNPNYAEAHCNLANVLKERGRIDEALASYEQALRLDAGCVSAHWNRSLALLQAGDYARGWPEYEWRWRRKQMPPRRFPQPRWDGSPLAGRSVLLYMEQGLGDMIQFIRYAALVKRRGGTVFVECPPFLVPLFAHCPEIDQLVPEGRPLPNFDVHAPLLSLPALFGTTLETVPAEIPYLATTPELVEHFRQRLAEDPGYKVGIVWQGNVHHKWDRHRSVPLAEFAPLARLPGVRLYSLQKGTGTEQLAAVGGAFRVRELAGELDARSGAFMETTAVIKNLDLVISVDTAVAHLAGALGTPVWLALSTLADWRWLRDREDSPWYPTMRLFRQTALDAWSPVFARMAGELQKLQRAKGGPPLIEIDVTPGELCDELALLEAQAEHEADPEQRRQADSRLAALKSSLGRPLEGPAELMVLMARLRGVHSALSQAGDEFRTREGKPGSDARLRELARIIGRLRVEREELRRRIDVLLGAAPAEASGEQIKPDASPTASSG